MKDLRDRAMLVRFKDTVWTGAKVDKPVGDKVAKDHGAKDGKVGWYKKRLVAKEVLETRSRIGNEARIWHYRNTLPWMDDGIRILPSANAAEYLAQMRKYEQAANSAAAEICRDFDKHIKEAKVLLGKLFCETDYPSASEIRRKFGFNYKVLPMPDITDWRAEGLSKEDLDALKKEAQAELAHIQAEAVADLWGRLKEVVAYVKERLDKDDAVFRNTLISNVKAICDILPKLNIMLDKDIEAVRKEVEKEIAGINPEDLRSDSALRKDTSKKAGALLRKMEHFMGAAKKAVAEK